MSADPAPAEVERRGRWEKPVKELPARTIGEVRVEGAKGFNCRLCAAGQLHTEAEHALMLRAHLAANPPPAKRRHA